MDNDTKQIDNSQPLRKPSKALYLVGYDSREPSVSDPSSGVERSFPELFRVPLVSGKVYTVGRKSPDFNPDIEIEDSSLHTSRMAATIYTPSGLERAEEGRDYVLFTHLGKNAPEAVYLKEQETPKGLLSKTARVLLGNESTHRKKDIIRRRTVEIYPGESVVYSHVSLELLASND